MGGKTQETGRNMNFKKLLVCAGIVGVSALGVGCGDDDVPVVPDGGTTCNAAALASGTTHVYAINVISIAAPEGDAEPFTSAGYNLDGNSVVACNDHIVGATAEFNGQAPDNGSGIDNSLGGDLSSLANTSLQDSVDSGSVLLIVEVKGVDDFTNDPCVGVTFYIGQLPEGVTAPTVDASGRIAAGQTFDLSSDSFTDGITGNNPRIQFPAARIVAGRLQAGPQDFPLSLSLMGASLALTIKDAQLRFNITSSAMSVGVLGGSLNTQEVIDTVNGIPSLATYADVVSSTLTSLADIDEDGDPTTCEAGSIALKLDGVTAVKGVVVAPPAPVDGGTPPPADAGPVDAGVAVDGG
jgi:hypothetical protein